MHLGISFLFSTKSSTSQWMAAISRKEGEEGTKVDWCGRFNFSDRATGYLKESGQSKLVLRDRNSFLRFDIWGFWVGIFFPFYHQNAWDNEWPLFLGNENWEFCHRVNYSSFFSFCCEGHAVSYNHDFVTDRPNGQNSQSFILLFVLMIIMFDKVSILQPI